MVFISDLGQNRCDNDEEGGQKGNSHPGPGPGLSADVPHSGPGLHDSLGQIWVRCLKIYQRIKITFNQVKKKSNTEKKLL